MKFGYAFVWVEDAEKAVQFYEEAFGLERRSLTDNGELGLYAEMETGATTLAIADQKEARVLFPDGFQENNPAQAPGAFQISFVTLDVKASYEATLQAGATRRQSRRPNRGAKPLPECETLAAFWSRSQAPSRPVKGRK